MTMKEAIQAAIHMQLDCVIFESDSQMVVQAIHISYGDNSEFSLIIRSIKSFLHCILNFEVKFANHQVNSIVHLFTKTKKI